MAERQQKESFVSGHTGRMFGLLTGGLAAVRVGRRVLPPLLPVLIAELGITPFEAGLVLSVASVSFGLLQYPSGRIGDRLTRKTALVASIALGILGGIILTLTPNYSALVVGAAVIGAGGGLYGPAARALISDMFHEKRGQAFGLFTLSTDLSGILAAGLVTGVLALATWRTVFFPIVVVLSVLLVLTVRWGKEPIRVARIPFGVRETVQRLSESTRFRWILLAYTLFAFTSNGIIGFLPTFLQAYHGLSLGLANGVFALLFAIGIVVRPIAGRLSDDIPRLYIGGSGLMLGALGIVVLVSGSSVWGAFIGSIVYALGKSAYPPAVQAHLMDTFPDTSMGGDLGATRTVYIGVGSLGPAYVGFLASQWNYVVAFAGFAVCYTLAGVIIFRLFRSR